MRSIAASGFGLACNSLTVFFAMAMLLGAPEARSVTPTLSGTPPSTATVGVQYWFRPKVYDPDGGGWYFSIRNKPSWLTFSTTNGILSGTPSASNVGTYSSIVISVSDSAGTRSLPAFSITVKSSGTSSTNSAPTISGTPPTSVAAGASYSFRPTASDANGDSLTFSITNKPVWATFSTSTGQLSGVPSLSHVGTYGSIAIKVSDGKVTTSLPVFSIAVTQIATGSASVSWMPPTSNTNGSSLTNLAGYRIKYGRGSTSLTQTMQIANPGITRYVINNLGSGTWYFGVVAYTSSGSESALSQLGIKTIK
jgi:hypothetical protein